MLNKQQKLIVSAAMFLTMGGLAIPAEAGDVVPAVDAAQVYADLVTYNRIDIRWNKIPDANVVSYKVMRNGILIGETSLPLFRDTTFSRGSINLYQVIPVLGDGTELSSGQGVKIDTHSDITIKNQLRRNGRINDLLPNMAKKIDGTGKLFDDLNFKRIVEEEKGFSKAPGNKTANDNNVYQHNALLELAQRYQDFNQLDKAMQVYEGILEHCTLNERTTLFVLHRLAVLKNNLIKAESTPSEIAATLLQMRNYYLEFNNLYPNAGVENKLFVNSMIAAAYFRYFPKLLDYVNYDVTAYNYALQAANNALEIQISAGSQLMLNIIQAWELRNIELKAGNTDTKIQITNNSANNNLSFLFPQKPYTDEREITIPAAQSVKIPIYAGHSYNLKFEFSVPGGRPLESSFDNYQANKNSQLNLPGVKTVVAANGVATVEMPTMLSPYNLKSEKYVDVFTLQWDFAPRQDFDFSYFKVFRGAKEIGKSITGNLKNIPLDDKSGFFTYKVVAYDKNDNPSPASAILEVLPGDMSVYMDYFSWREAHFPNVAILASDDADQDGIDTYHEYLVNSDPNLPYASDMQITKALPGEYHFKWDISDDNSYQISRNNQLIATVNGNEYVDCDVMPGGSYTYKIRPLKNSQFTKDWSRGISLRAPAPQLPHGDLKSYKTVGAVLKNYDFGTANEEGIVSGLKHIIGSGKNTKLSSEEQNKLDNFLRQEISSIKELGSNENGLTPDELKELTALLKNFYNSESYETVYAYNKLIDLGDKFKADYFKDKSNLRNYELAKSFYLVALDYIPDKERFLFTNLRSLSELILAEINESSSLDKRVTILNEYAATLLSFFNKYPNADSFMAKQIYGFIINANFDNFPKLLNYDNYNNEFFNKSCEIAAQALNLAPDRYLYIMRQKQLNAWQLKELEVVFPANSNSGKLIVKNISGETGENILPLGVLFQDEREFSIANSMNIPIYQGHKYAIKVEVPVANGEKMIYDLGVFSYSPDQTLDTAAPDYVIGKKAYSGDCIVIPGVIPGKPYNLQAIPNSDEKFSLSWNFVAPDGFELEHYEIYRGELLLKTVTANHAENLSRNYQTDGRYIYKVRAVATDGRTGEFSSLVEMMPPADNEEFQYHNWCIKYFGEVVNKNDDFDQDGLTNYQEFVLNSNPKLAPVNEPVLDNERIKSGFHSNYFAGAFEEMPDFTTIEAYKSGIIKTLNSTDINILDSEREQGFAASFDGFIKMQNSGSYRFYMAADDHAVLYLDGVKVGTAKSSNSVVDNTSYFDLSLLQGVHAIRVEYLQRAGNGMLKLEWAGPDFQRRFITEGDVWHFVVPNENYDEVINWQKDSDFDGVRDVIEINRGTNPFSADSDLDKLSDYEELFIFNTNPLLVDTDGDGVNDYEEVKFALSNPLVIDFSGKNKIIQTKNGRDAFSTSANWQRKGDAIVCVNNSGNIEYQIELNQTKQLVARLNGSEGCSVTEPNKESVFRLSCYIDNNYVGERELRVAGTATAEIDFYLPELKSGPHNIRFIWNNVLADTFLQINKIDFIELGGTDNNSNSQADWIDNRLQKLQEMNIPSSSLVSPLCIEGEKIPGQEVVISVQGKLGTELKMPYWHGEEIVFLASNSVNDSFEIAVPTAKSGMVNRFYADVPLYADGDTVITVNNTGIAGNEKTVAWNAINIFNGGVYTIRRGDSLKFTAVPEDKVEGESKIYINSSELNMNDSGFAVGKFDRSGIFKVNAEFIPQSGGSALNGEITINVLSGELSGAPYALAGVERKWNNPSLSSKLYLEYDPRITMFVTPQAGGSEVVFYGSIPCEARVVSRLNAGGAILDAGSITVFGCRTHRSEGYYKLLEVFADNTKMLEGKLILDYVPDDLEIHLNIVTAGTTFLDGTISKVLTAADFDANGVCKYQMLKAPESASSTCHSIDFYQNGVKIFDYQN